jgi:glycosyltransferase involved in cell wall biosynthesis
MKISIWLSVLSEHQIHTFNYLEKLARNQIEYIVSENIENERRQQGWNEIDRNNLNIQNLQKYSWLIFGFKYLKKRKDAIHIFGGFLSDMRFIPLILIAQRLGIKTVLIMEPYPEVPVSYFGDRLNLIENIKHILRPYIYKNLGKLIAKKCIAVFPISEKGVSQFIKMQIPERNIYPFGYFIPRVEILNSSERDKNINPIRAIFVGSLIERKGISTIYEAMNYLNTKKIHIDIYGHASLKSDFVYATENITIKGPIKFGETQVVMSNYDLLILPSLHDGWGVVVNEALLQGVPAIVSSQTGAKILIERSKAGAVFESGNALDLAGILGKLIENPDMLVGWKNNINKIEHIILPKIAGQYLYDCLNRISKRATLTIKNPWYRN